MNIKDSNNIIINWTKEKNRINFISCRISIRSWIKEALGEACFNQTTETSSLSPSEVDEIKADPFDVTN
nr:hypothetical protein [Entomoplasma sp. MP1]